MSNASIDLPRVHVAGAEAHADTHLEVGQHGFALFLTPDPEYPLLDIDGTPEQLDRLVHDLQNGVPRLTRQPDVADEGAR